MHLLYIVLDYWQCIFTTTALVSKVLTGLSTFSPGSLLVTVPPLGSSAPAPLTTHYTCCSLNKPPTSPSSVLCACSSLCLELPSPRVRLLLYFLSSLLRCLPIRHKSSLLSLSFPSALFSFIASPPPDPARVCLRIACLLH